jgi:hypothetical protein
MPDRRDAAARITFAGWLAILVIVGLYAIARAR